MTADLTYEPFRELFRGKLSRALLWPRSIHSIMTPIDISHTTSIWSASLTLNDHNYTTLLKYTISSYERPKEGSCKRAVWSKSKKTNPKNNGTGPTNTKKVFLQIWSQITWRLQQQRQIERAFMRQVSHAIGTSVGLSIYMDNGHTPIPM